MPRILITGFCALPGSNRAGVQLHYVMKALALKHNVDALVIRLEEQAYVERQGNARILRVPLSGGDLLEQVESFRRALRRQLEGADYDIVHFRDGWTGATVLDRRPQFDYLTVFDAARGPSAEAPLMDLEIGSELARLERACLTGADMVLVPTESARVYASAQRPQRIHVVPPGVDVDLFDWDDRQSGPPVILYAGTIEPGRGVRVLLRAMVYVTRQLDARLLIAGTVDNDFRKSLKSAIKDLGLTGRAEILGEVPHQDMPALIARATVCVAPAAPESRSQPLAVYPTKLLEYMACRRAVVAPRRGTTSMLMDGVKHGLIFTPGDPLDLSRNILTLLQNENLREQLANAGYQLVRHHHTASATRRALRRAYRYILDRTPKPPPIAHLIGQTDPEISTHPNVPQRSELSEPTDEYQVPFVDRDYSPGDVAAIPGDITNVDRQSLEPDGRGAIEHDEEWTELATEPPTKDDGEGARDEWVVPDWGDNTDGWRSLADDDDEGTPLDVKPAPAAGLEENRFVAGEIEVHSESTERETAIDEESSFTAVGVLLGTTNDDADGSGRDKSE